MGSLGVVAGRKARRTQHLGRRRRDDGISPDLYEDAPAEVRNYPTFRTWIAESYVRRQGLGIRRQVDMDGDVVSLAWLIDRVRRYPNVLSRDRYAARTADGQSRPEADRDFAQLVGPARDHIDPNVAPGDCATLRTRTGKVVKWVDNEVAHYNQAKGQFGIDPLFDELHGAIDLIVNLFVKYRQLILGETMVRSVVMQPWPRIFRVAWIHDDERFRDMWRQILEAEQRRR